MTIVVETASPTGSRAYKEYGAPSVDARRYSSLRYKSEYDPLSAPRQIYPNVYRVKISSARLKALSTAAVGVIPFFMTSACATPQSCSALTWPQAG